MWHGTVTRIPATGVVLEAELSLPDRPAGVVLLAEASGRSRRSARNRDLADRLAAAGLATVVSDLLTPSEERVDERTGQLRFDIGMLAGRLVGELAWLREESATHDLPAGLFAGGTATAATLRAAAHRPDLVSAVVSGGGRPDLASSALREVQAPTLLIVGGSDVSAVDEGRASVQQLPTPAELRVIPGATRLLPEPQTWAEVGELTSAWFRRHLPAS
jgi:dienelactone hydrolase